MALHRPLKHNHPLSPFSLSCFAYLWFLRGFQMSALFRYWFSCLLKDTRSALAVCLGNE